MADARGFTLIELLVCMLILGILAAVALPSWLGQRAKAQDSEAKMTIRVAALALHSHALEHDTFDATVAELVALEPSLAEASDLEVSGEEDGYEVSELSATGTVFTQERAADGTITRDCTAYGYGLCRADPDASGDFW